MRRCFGRCCVIAFLLCCTEGFAHDSEPINTEFAAPFARGSGNLQFGAQYFRDEPVYDVVPVEFEWGFAPRMQLSVATPLTRRDEDGRTDIRPGNVEIAYRYLLAGGSHRKFAVSINPEATLPTGDKRVAERAYELGAAIHIDTHLLRRLWTHTNLGYETPVARFEEKEKTFFYRFAAMFHASKRMQPVLEVVGDREFHEGVTRLAIVPEVILTPNHNWEIKAGVPLGVTQATPGVGLQVQVTWKFGKHDARQ
ncbi:MAG TPA: hypothetical protein VLE48_11275 [Terriglobales bacterium]|nr:hypothetical protein [Terriglobales bacterium]